MQSVTLIIVVVYLVLLFGVCAIVTKRNEKKAKEGEEGGASGFLMAGQSLPLILVAVMMAGNAIGGTYTLGIAELATTAGLSACMYGLAGVIAIIILGVFGAKRMRRLNCTTVPQLVGNHCGKKSQYLVVIGSLLNMLCIVCLQYVAGGAMLAAMFPDYISTASGMVITAVAFLGLSMIGGLFGASVANFINVIVIYIGLLACFFVSLNDVGGISELVSSVDNLNLTTSSGGSWFGLTGGIGLATVMSYFISEPANRFTVQSNVQCVFAAKDVKSAKWGVILGAIICAPLAVICALFGLIAIVKFPGVEGAAALPTIIMSLSPILAGIGMAGLWAVNISTGVALLMAVVQVSFSDLFMEIFGHKVKSEKQEVRLSKVTLVVMFAVTLIVSFFLKGMVSAIITVQCVIPSFAIVVVCILYCPRLLKKRSAFITMLVSYIFFLLWLIIPPLKTMFPSPIYAQWPLAVVTFICCYFFDKERIEPNTIRERQII